MYLLLEENNLCAYYRFDENPGIKARGKFVSGNFAYLDDETVINRLARFRSKNQINVLFELPQVHCTSCIYLLENLHKIEVGIIQSTVNFYKKEVFISFDPEKISLRKVVELLAFIGYEPAISMKEDVSGKSPVNRKKIFHLGLSGFCFSNIMMLSFPEYFSSGIILEHGLKETFTWLIFALSLPVLFIGASSIFLSAFKGLRQKELNIDVPIVLAIIMTFGRSYYEIFTGTGAGFLDSGTGIIFFMLVGRWFQGKTNDALAFDRDYKSYFPLGVTVIKEGEENNIPVTRLDVGDTIVLRSGEMIPADSILEEGSASVDYSFVTGEGTPVDCMPGEMLFAGGKQRNGRVLLKVIKPASQSYITELWNNDVFAGKRRKRESFVHPWSRYFTLALLVVALSTFVFWYLTDPSKIFPAVTAVLIVACPCSLLLSSTFTFGSMIRYFGKSKLFLKNSFVIEQLAQIDTIVFDKTGTVTETETRDISYSGNELSTFDKQALKTLAMQSSHILSMQLAESIKDEPIPVAMEGFKELAGSGIEARVNERSIKLGAASFAGNISMAETSGARVYVAIDEDKKGYFEIKNRYRKGFKRMIWKLADAGFNLHLLSGDNDAERSRLYGYFEGDLITEFNVSPAGKLEYIKDLQQRGRKVLMIGDGLNDAGALMQSDVGIAVSDHSARFTPASDGIMDGSMVTTLHSLLSYARSGKLMITTGFVLSILYNFVGLSFAVQAKLSPLIAAILMPASSISIVAVAALLSAWSAKRCGLSK